MGDCRILTVENYIPPFNPNLAGEGKICPQEIKIVILGNRMSDLPQT